MVHNQPADEPRIFYTSSPDPIIDFEQSTQELDALLQYRLNEIAKRLDAAEAAELTAEVESTIQSPRDMGGLMARGRLLSRLAALADDEHQDAMRQYHPEVSPC